jgi:hypothetical protein
MTLTTTLNALHKARACTDRYRVLVNGLGGLSYGKTTPITLLQILDICGLNDALWALRTCGPTNSRDRFARELACDYAARALPIWDAKYPEDKRPAQAIEVARLFARGEATEQELVDAWASADAARASAYATWASAYAARASADAAWASTDAAWASADAVWASADAARASAYAARASADAAWSSADAARASADAAWASAYAARASEKKWQTEHLRGLLQNAGDR